MACIGVQLDDIMINRASHLSVWSYNVDNVFVDKMSSVSQAVSFFHCVSSARSVYVC